MRESRRAIITIFSISCGHDNFVADLNTTSYYIQSVYNEGLRIVKDQNEKYSVTYSLEL